jgi:hypothetical protein
LFSLRYLIEIGRIKRIEIVRRGSHQIENHTGAAWCDEAGNAVAADALPAEFVVASHPQFLPNVGFHAAPHLRAPLIAASHGLFDQSPNEAQGGPTVQLDQVPGEKITRRRLSRFAVTAIHSDPPSHCSCTQLLGVCLGAL